jgi:hypothetical protein
MEEIIRSYAGDEVYDQLLKSGCLQPAHKLVLATGAVINLVQKPEAEYEVVINLKRINNVRDVDGIFRATNQVLKKNGLFVGCVETTGQRKHRLFRKYPPVLNGVYYFGDYIFKRVFPKMKLTRWFYLWITSDRNRVMSLPETMGRLYYAGFREENQKTIGGYTYFFYRKEKEPVINGNPSYGPFVQMKRVGYKGREINVYKVRTMAPYSEFIQDYVYQKNHLKRGGKFESDFRISWFGHLLRKYWIDELPMLLNLVKGEVKLVGIRPLSRHYLSLYDHDLQKIRQTVKPGLFPPYYADLPQTLEEIMASERRYIDLYQKHPLKTNMVYFWRILKNIIFRGVRSS